MTVPKRPWAALHCRIRKRVRHILSIPQSEHGKEWTKALDGNRFNLFSAGVSGNVPTIYVADIFGAAALESVFHAASHTPLPNTVNGNVPRNLGTMPSLCRWNSDLSRTIFLNPKAKDHPLSLTFNARDANLLNHTSTTGMNEYVLSPALGQPISAEAARRIELVHALPFESIRF